MAWLGHTDNREHDARSAFPALADAYASRRKGCVETRVQHGPFVGWANPRCGTCGRNQMWIQRNPLAACERQAAQLPFEEIRPVAVKAEIRLMTKERAS